MNFLALELAVENDSQIILNDPRVQRVIEVCIYMYKEIAFLIKCPLINKHIHNRTYGQRDLIGHKTRAIPVRYGKARTRRQRVIEKVFWEVLLVSSSSIILLVGPVLDTSRMFVSLLGSFTWDSI